MIPREILKQVKRIEITTKRLVSETFSGEYTSVFKGQGIEFADVREYVPGDDIRSIDWNVTARSDRPFVKQFVEERELTIMFLVDSSASVHFGSGQKLKAEVAAELCALLAFSAVKNNDKVGILIFTDEIEKFIAPSKGTRNALRVIREILYYKPKKLGTDLEGALTFTDRILTRSAVVFVISDFMCPAVEKPLKRLARRHDVIAIRLFDKRESEFPHQGLIELEDSESGEQRLVDCSSGWIRKRFEGQSRARREGWEKSFNRTGVDLIDIDVTKPYVDPILRFFHKRTHRH